MLDRLANQLQRYFVEHAYEILGAAIFLLVAVLVAFVVGRAVRFVMLESFRVDASIAKLAVRLLRFIIVVLALVVVLGEFGIDVTSVIAAFSVIGLAMAFGLRSTMTNFFTGAMIGALKPYEVGDEIDAERVKGVVESTNLFCTVVVSDDGTYVSVPNGPMWAKSIKNKSRVRPVRLILDVNVDRTASLSDISKVIGDAFAADQSRCTDFSPRVNVEEVTETEMVLQASAWYSRDAFWHARETLPNTLSAMLDDLGVKEHKVVPRSVAKPKPRTKEPEVDPAADDLV